MAPKSSLPPLQGASLPPWVTPGRTGVQLAFQGGVWYSPLEKQSPGAEGPRGRVSPASGGQRDLRGPGWRGHKGTPAAAGGGGGQDGQEFSLKKLEPQKPYLPDILEEWYLPANTA